MQKVCFYKRNFSRFEKYVWFSIIRVQSQVDLVEFLEEILFLLLIMILSQKQYIGLMHVCRVFSLEDICQSYFNVILLN